jgi:hypothetical protein
MPALSISERTRGQALPIGASLLLAAVALAAFPWPLVSVAAAIACVYVSNFVRLGRLIRQPVVRRLVRCALFLLPLPAVGVGFDLALLPLLVAVVPPLALHAFQRRDIRISLDPTIRALRPFPNRAAKAADVLTTASSGLCQEYLYRYALFAALLTLDSSPGPVLWAAFVAVSAALFFAEHLIGLSTPPTTRYNLGVWAGSGLLFALVGGPLGSWVAAVVGHTLLNLPAILLGALRPAAKESR